MGNKTVADQIEETIQDDLISNRSVPWESCVEQLEQLAEFCQEWARTIKDEHE